MTTDGPAGEMPFLDHLEELRYRLLWIVGTLFVCVMAAFAVVLRYDVIGMLSAPVQQFLPAGKLVFTHPADPFSITLKIAFGVGLVVSLPMILYHLWAFLAPALYAHEKRVVLPVIFGATGLFAVGVYLAVLWVLPASFDVLFGIQSAALEPMITATDYFSFAIAMCLACGACFQLPIVVGALTALGVVTPGTLARYRRHAMVGSLVVAAIITPGDLLLMTLMLGVPLYGLYEVSLVVSWFIHRRRKRRERLAASERIGGAPA